MTTRTAYARCDDCGPRVVPCTDITITALLPWAVTAYTFRCPKCGLRTARETPPRTCALLLDLGATLRMWTMPLELADADRMLVEPIDPDEQIDLYLELAETDCVVERMESA